MNKQSKFYKFRRELIHYVYPCTCKICAVRCETSSEQGICARCQPTLPYHNHSREHVCECCGVELAPSSVEVGSICGECLSCPPYYDHVYASFWYREPINRLISELKYHQCWENLSCLICGECLSCPPIPEHAQILAVPSHPRRVRERGFNVINQCVRTWRSYQAFDYSLNSLVRTRYTATQTGMKRKQRIKNMRQIFAVRKSLRSDEIILFDDVMTTGTTANECARVIKQAGAKRVEVWCLARA